MLFFSRCADQPSGSDGNGRSHVRGRPGWVHRPSGARHGDAPGVFPGDGPPGGYPRGGSGAL